MQTKWWEFVFMVSYSSQVCLWSCTQAKSGSLRKAYHQDKLCSLHHDVQTTHNLEQARPEIIIDTHKVCHWVLVYLRSSLSAKLYYGPGNARCTRLFTSCTAQSKMFLTASRAALFGDPPVKSPITDTATALCAIENMCHCDNKVHR